MNGSSNLTNEIGSNVTEKNFEDINSNSNQNIITNSNQNLNSNSIFLSITHNTQIINSNTNSINLLDNSDNLRKSIKLDYEQFYNEVKKLVLEESLDENENEKEIYIVLNKVKEMVKKIIQIKKKEIKNMESKLAEIIEEQNDIKNKTKILNKDKKLSINNCLHNSIIRNDYLPELLSPEDNYKALINSIRQFEYEENIYDKYLTKDDLNTLKSFPKKLDKYLEHLEENKRKRNIFI